MMVRFTFVSSFLIHVSHIIHKAKVRSFPDSDNRCRSLLSSAWIRTSESCLVLSFTLWLCHSAWLMWETFLNFPPDIHIRSVLRYSRPSNRGQISFLFRCRLCQCMLFHFLKDWSLHEPYHFRMDTPSCSLTYCKDTYNVDRSLFYILPAALFARSPCTADSCLYIATLQPNYNTLIFGMLPTILSWVSSFLTFGLWTCGQPECLSV